MNAILVVTRKPELLRTAATWIARLDQSDTAQHGVQVYRVRYGDARQIAALLNDMFVGRPRRRRARRARRARSRRAAECVTSSSDRRPVCGGAGRRAATAGAASPAAVGGEPRPARAAHRRARRSARRGGRRSAPGGTVRATQPTRPRRAAAAGRRRRRPAILPGVRITADVTNNRC